MNKFTPLLAALFFVPINLSAQCPIVQNCNATTDTICGFALNDSLLWAGGMWWDPVHEINDIAEAPADLSLRIVDTCGGATTLRYLLFLDLDNDGSLETVLNSDSLPPAATVYFNNADNPGYAGGTPRVFDSRSVATDEKHRFALRQTLFGDTIVSDVRWTTDADPGLFVTPALPIGKHKIIWFIETSSGTDTCTRNFVIRDCQPPSVTCVNDLSVHIQATGLVTVWAYDLLENASDNVTPPTLKFPLQYQLQTGIRRLGDGNGFPWADLYEPATSIVYNCCELGSMPVELWVRDQAGNENFCIAYINVQENDGFCNCSGEAIYGCAVPFWNGNTAIEDVIFQLELSNISGAPISLFANSMMSGCFNFGEILDAGSSYNLKSAKNINPLNGVTTYDLVLITKHILGLQLFDAPWKTIAADANKSNSVTTFDIVELRKLILGIYDTLPGNTSWRFIPSDFVFPFPDNPFAVPFPDLVTVSNFNGNAPAEHIFLGLKVGDVNSTALPSDFVPMTNDRTAAFVTLPDLYLKTGETTEINLQTSEAGIWLGFQLGLRFDPDAIEIEQVVSNSLPGMDENAWALPQPGVLNLSWFDIEPHTVLPDENLLTLRIRALADVHLREVVSTGGRLVSEAYTADEIAHPLQLQFAEKTVSGAVGQTAIFPPQPNPTSAGAVIPIRLAQSEFVSVAVTDFSGKTIFQQKKLLEHGAQMLEIPATAFPQTGVYVWRVTAGEVTETGKMVRM